MINKKEIFNPKNMYEMDLMQRVYCYGGCVFFDKEMHHEERIKNLKKQLIFFFNKKD